MKTYMTTKVKFTELEKKLNRLFKKLDAIGATYTFNKVRDFVDDVPVYAIDELTQTKHKVDTVKVECVEFELDFDTYKVGDYRLAAVLERTTDENDNLVYTIDETLDYKKYAHTALRCDHCHTAHNRKKAIVLIDNNSGNEIVVGKTCVKVFIGICTDTFSNYLYGINEILNDIDDGIWDNDMHLYTRVIDNVEYLARCIDLTEKKGYYKSLKADAIYNLKNRVDDKYYELAKKVIDFYENYETVDNFEHNIRMFVTGRTPIVSENGFVAYAYTQYVKILDKQRKEAERLATVAKSNYVGETGKKYTFTGRIERVAGYETDYGYMTVLTFRTNEGNAIVWKTTSNPIEKDYTEIGTVEVTGTVKEHKEYRDEKQTILTRCKIREVVGA